MEKIMLHSKKKLLSAVLAFGLAISMIPQSAAKSAVKEDLGYKTLVTVHEGQVTADRSDFVVSGEEYVSNHYQVLPSDMRRVSTKFPKLSQRDLKQSKVIKVKNNDKEFAAFRLGTEKAYHHGDRYTAVPLAHYNENADRLRGILSASVAENDYFLRSLPTDDKTYGKLRKDKYTNDRFKAQTVAAQLAVYNAVEEIDVVNVDRAFRFDDFFETKGKKYYLYSEYRWPLIHVSYGDYKRVIEKLYHEFNKEFESNNEAENMKTLDIKNVDVTLEGENLVVSYQVPSGLSVKSTLGESEAVSRDGKVEHRLPLPEANKDLVIQAEATQSFSDYAVLTSNNVNNVDLLSSAKVAFTKTDSANIRLTRENDLSLYQDFKMNLLAAVAKNEPKKWEDKYGDVTVKVLNHEGDVVFENSDIVTLSEGDYKVLVDYKANAALYKGDFEDKEITAFSVVRNENGELVLKDGKNIVDVIVPFELADFSYTVNLKQMFNNADWKPSENGKISYNVFAAGEDKEALKEVTEKEFGENSVVSHTFEKEGYYHFRIYYNLKAGSVLSEANKISSEKQTLSKGTDVYLKIVSFSLTRNEDGDYLIKFIYDDFSEKDGNYLMNNEVK